MECTQELHYVTRYPVVFNSLPHVKKTKDVTHKSQSCPNPVNNVGVPPHVSLLFRMSYTSGQKDLSDSDARSTRRTSAAVQWSTIMLQIRVLPGPNFAQTQASLPLTVTTQFTTSYNTADCTPCLHTITSSHL